ncbi:MAG: methionine adenosyltransferase [Anaerolineales bacterium]|jgi:S-adenosylmethionine synthetase
MERNIVVTESTGQFIEDLPVEIVERKGMGHPDSLCDGIAERISVEYTRWCEENLGLPMHHNFDKVQLVAGDVQVGFGSGELLRPIRIQIAGRGTREYQGRQIPVDSLAIQAAKAHVRETMRYLDPEKHLVVDCYAGRGSGELIHTVDDVRANDTSFGCAHWPRSDVETAVFESAQYLNFELINQFPIGEDVKVMGMRRGDNILLTCAVPFLGPQLKDVTEYLEAKRSVQEAVQAFAQKLIQRRRMKVDVNTADNEETGEVYLTLTGTSAEMGDDGSVGRGNRVSGLITPFRSASLEAAAGKNPISHVGKIYNVLSLLAAQDIIEKVPGAKEASVYILSQIGHPLDQPLICTASITSTNGTVSETDRRKVADILNERLANVHQVRSLLAKRQVMLY